MGKKRTQSHMTGVAKLEGKNRSRKNRRGRSTNFPKISKSHSTDLLIRIKVLKTKVALVFLTVILKKKTFKL